MGAYINQNLLNNLFYILVSIFVFYFIYDHGKWLKTKHRHQQVLFIICTGFPLLLCMKFPIYIADNCVHDLRQIPFLIGTLYGGGIVGGVLLLILLTVRFVFYGFQFLTIIVYVTMLIITALVSPTFRQLNRTGKLLMSVWFTLFLAILTTFIAVVVSDFQVTDSYIFDFILIPPIVMLFVVYIMETLKEAIMMRSKLVKVEKMEIVSQLAASISHEVRNPLTVVKGFIQLLKSHSLSQEMREKYIHIALEEIDRAETIINDYLAFAKPTSDKTERLMVDKELNMVIHMLEPMARMNSIQIVKELQPSLMMGNVQHFRQCFLNLMKNSIEAMPNGGVLKVSSYVREHDIIITIEDNGIGMTSEQVSRFGEPYFSTKEKGTGLGSMVAVKIIETMQGTLHIQSEVNKGTIITVTFPKAMD
jgi:two-component system sporulation sensor kinase B